MGAQPDTDDIVLCGGKPYITPRTGKRHIIDADGCTNPAVLEFTPRPFDGLILLPTIAYCAECFLSYIYRLGEETGNVLYIGPDRKEW